MIIIACIAIVLYVVINIILAPTKEEKFLKEDCPKGGKHDVVYKPFGITFQELNCTSCGKKLTIDK